MIETNDENFEGVVLDGRQLIWLPAEGVGYYPVKAEEVPYDAAYFAKYELMAKSEIGRELNKFRRDLVWRYAPTSELLDVGIGDGAFLREVLGFRGAGKTFGYDVNPAGVEWLKGRDLFGDLYRDGGWKVLTFWDSLEHIPDPSRALMQCADVAFVSIPIFRDCAHALASKHFRPDEHYWYFTRDGFVRFAARCGFEVLDVLATETALGREDIETFVLMREE